MEAQSEYRKARDPMERLRCLEHMLAVIPKHKGTEKMQADIKSRIKKLKDTGWVSIYARSKPSTLYG